MKIGEFITNATLEKEGVWKEIGPDARLKIARAGNPDHEAVIAELEREYRAKAMAGDGELPAPVRRQIAIRASARAILKDWEGLTDDDGVPFPPYSEEAGVKVMTAAKDFANLVSNLAYERRGYQDTSVRFTVKNFEG